MIAALGWLWRGGVLGIIAFVIFGPLANLVLWAVAIQWYFPHKLPLTYGLRYWTKIVSDVDDIPLLLIGVRLWGLIARPMTTDVATWQILWTDQI